MNNFDVSLQSCAFLLSDGDTSAIYLGGSGDTLSINGGTPDLNCECEGDDSDVGSVYDVNQDGDVDVLDVVFLVNVILTEIDYGYLDQ